MNFIKPDIIFHLAAQPLVSISYKNPHLTWTSNLISALNLCEILKSYTKKVTCLIITSDKCYENLELKRGYSEHDRLGGKDPYSGSKASAEIMINSYMESFYKSKNCGLASARAGNVIGGGDWSENRLIPDIVNSIIKGKTIKVRNPNFNRPWQHVLEPLYGYLLLGEKLFKKPKTYSGAWNFGTKKNTVTTVHEVVKKIIQFWGQGKYRLKIGKKFYEQKNPSR